MNLVARHELRTFIQNDLEGLLKSIHYRKDIEVRLQDDHIWELRTTKSDEDEINPMAIKVLNIHDIKNIEHASDHLFITLEDDTVIHVCKDGDCEAEQSFYNTVRAGGVNTII